MRAPDRQPANRDGPAERRRCLRHSLGLARLITQGASRSRIPERPSSHPRRPRKTQRRPPSARRSGPAQASIDDPSDAAIHLLEGRILAALKKESDAKAQFQACVATPGATPLQCRRANAYAQNISLTTHDEAPEFTIIQADGTPVTLDSLAGKVVLIDFWATWCGPCARDLDYVQSIAEEFEKDNFVLLGISIDENEAVWKNHIKENRMIGIQVRDTHNGMHDLFHVAGIPTYLILDSNGIIRYRTTGDLKDLRTRVRTLMKEASATPTQPASKAAGR